LHGKFTFNTKTFTALFNLHQIVINKTYGSKTDGNKQNDPNIKIGVIAKGCDERALIELAKREQIDMKNIEILGVACSREEAVECRCPRPYPNNPLIGEKVEGVFEDKSVGDLLNKGLSERLVFWQYQLSKCIKCYGCRNACPLCFCQDCAMEQEEWSKTGEIPP